MDSYLDIARVILRASRRPMGARAILEAAHKAGVVPKHLRGKTQQKTLQARLSEDILHNRGGSIFYRTEPGQFALKEFLDDPSFPDKWKSQFPARRRTRDLKRPDNMAIQSAFAASLENVTISMSEFLRKLEASSVLAAMHPKEMQKRGYCGVWTFSIVRKADCVLAYRVGRYRDDRDTFANRRSIGFPGALAAGDISLFSTDRLGVTDCAIAVLQQDLDLSLATFERTPAHRPVIEGVTALTDLEGALDLVIVVSWESPDWFEPTTRKLSLNEPNWLCSSSRPNDMEDFEPWSARILEWLAAKEPKDIGHAEDYSATSCLPQV